MICETLTHLPLDKMAAISQTMCSNAFSWMKSFVFWFKYHWSWFLSVQLAISKHWLGPWLSAEQATNHYLNPGIWTNADLVHRHIYVALGWDELTLVNVNVMELIHKDENVIWLINATVNITLICSQHFQIDVHMAWLNFNKEFVFLDFSQVSRQFG